MKRKVFHEFSAARAGEGLIDLSNGTLTFMHETTNAESSILPVDIMHVYQSRTPTTNGVFGRGWKLNLEQSLRKVLPNNPNDTRYIFTDGTGQEHDFEERYFIRLVNGNKSFNRPNTSARIQRSDLRIEQDGWLRLVSNNQEAFAEMCSDSNLTLQIRPKGFVGSQKIEVRHEEMIRLGEEIKGIERNIEDMRFQFQQLANTNLNANLLGRLRSAFPGRTHHATPAAFITNMTPAEVFNTNVTNFTLQERQEFLRLIRERFTRLMQKGMRNTRRLRRTDGRILDPFSDNYHDRNRYELTNRNGFTFLNDSDGFNMEAFNVLVQRSSSYHSNGERMQGRLHAQAIFSTEFNEKIEMIRQKIDEVTTHVENTRHTQVETRCREDLAILEARLAQRQFQYGILKRQMPVDYIVGEKILGFNDAGQLVTIFDNYDNQTSIIYRDGRISRVVDSEERETALEYVNGRLEWINDFQDRKTYFRYDANGRLIRIEYPDDTNSTFTYNTSHQLLDVISPSGIGKRLTWLSGRVTRISALSNSSRINSAGVSAGALSLETMTDINHNASARTTVLTDIKTGERTTYFFDSNLDLVHEHFQGEYSQTLTTMHEDANHEALITQDVNETSNITTIRTQHLNWARTPNTLPVFRNDLEWEVADLNADGNPTRKRYSERVHPSNQAIRQSLEERFLYKHFMDGRESLLIRSESIIRTTGEADRVESIQYFHNKQGDVIRTISEPDGMVEETGYNKQGLEVHSATYHKSSPDKRFVEKYEVEENGQVTASFDESGEHKTKFDYLKGTNKVSRTTDPRGNATTFGLDFSTSHVSSMASVADGQRNGTTFGYTADYLTKLESGDTKFEYAYDGRGRKSSVTHNESDVPYVSYAYSTESHDLHNNMGVVSCDIVEATYANGEIYRSFSDKFGRLLAIRYTPVNESEGTILRNYYEDKDEEGNLTGKLSQTIDFKTEETIRFEYDNDGNVTRQAVIGFFHDDKTEDPERFGSIPAQFLEIKNEIDIDGQVTQADYTVDDREKTYRFNYENQELKSIILPTSETLKVEADNLGRFTGEQLLDPTHRKILSSEFRYLQSNEYATSLVNIHTQEIGNKVERTRYKYDENGNITHINDSFNKVVQTYEYDELNRLVKDGDTEISYDTNGNILFKGDVEYRYNGDQLVQFGNETGFDYDALGNPIEYRGKNLNWSHLRSLTKYDDVEFKYNVAGLRTYKDHQKKINGEDTRYESYYQWLGDKLLSETRTTTTNSEENGHTVIHTKTDTLDYIYGVDGMVGFTLNKDKHYYYVKNLQGDVTKVISQSGETVAEYKYDAWGNILESSGELAETNPIRYRGYYYDIETGLYYLKSRYYDSQVGRFLNMDEINILDESKAFINGLNLYSYCNNNPVMNVDHDGRRWWRWLVAAVVIVAAVALTVVTAGLAAPIAGVLGGGLVGTIIGGAVVGAIGGAVMGAAISIASQGVSNGFNNINWSEVGRDALVGGIAGALTGGVFSAGSFGASKGLQFLARKGVKTGRKGGFLLKKGKKGGIRALSPNSLQNPNVGGTLIKFGKTTRIDVEIGRQLHAHIGFFGSRFSQIHIPLGHIVNSFMSGTLGRRLR